MFKKIYMVALPIVLSLPIFIWVYPAFYEFYKEAVNIAPSNAIIGTLATTAIVFIYGFLVILWVESVFE